MIKHTEIRSAVLDALTSSLGSDVIFLMVAPLF